MSRFVDLHAHTTASDGLLSPAELVAHATRIDLQAIAVTDHDTTAGVGEALAAARGTALEVVPGVEISTSHAGVEIHLLGYFVEPDSPELTRQLAQRREDREERAREMVERLRALGLRVDYEDVLREAGNGSVGRPHVAGALVARGQVRDRQEAFDRYIGDGRPAAVPKPVFPLADAIVLLTEMGAVSVLAHPGLLRRPELLQELPRLGLAGVEVFYPKHHPDQVRELLSFAETHGLVPTGGSDFHAPGQPAPLGSQRVPAEVLEELRARRFGGSPAGRPAGLTTGQPAGGPDPASLEREGVVGEPRA
jgi:predicted metal-dependent phosphoesterase TrpH